MITSFEMLYDTLRTQLGRETKTYLNRQDGLDDTTTDFLITLAQQIYTSYDFIGNLEILSKDTKSKKKLRAMNAD